MCIGLDLSLDFRALAEVGSMLGSAGCMVMDSSVCMVKALLINCRFFAHESCGQCTPCREGAPWIRDVVKRIERGGGKPGDIDLLLNVADNVAGLLSPRYSTICLFGPAFSYPTQGTILAFREEFEEHIRQGRCPIRKDKGIQQGISCPPSR